MHEKLERLSLSVTVKVLLAGGVPGEVAALGFA
jgi:hypothetical protein